MADAQDDAQAKAIQALDAYNAIIAPMRKKARELGYAIAVHGSLARDIDLLACPWTANAVDERTLAVVLQSVILEVDGTATMSWAVGKGRQFALDGCPGTKPHGRLGWCFTLTCGVYVDLAVMPRIVPTTDSKIDQHAAQQYLVEAARKKAEDDFRDENMRVAVRDLYAGIDPTPRSATSKLKAMMAAEDAKFVKPLTLNKMVVEHRVELDEENAKSITAVNEAPMEHEPTAEDTTAARVSRIVEDTAAERFSRVEELTNRLSELVISEYRRRSNSADYAVALPEIAIVKTELRWVIGLGRDRTTFFESEPGKRWRTVDRVLAQTLAANLSMSAGSGPVTAFESEANKLIAELSANRVWPAHKPCGTRVGNPCAHDRKLTEAEQTQMGADTADALSAVPAAEVACPSCGRPGGGCCVSSE